MSVTAAKPPAAGARAEVVRRDEPIKTSAFSGAR
jgi:hypothetical protein